MLLLPEPLEQRGDMYLIGLVVAGQRVHDDVDAGAERELALARLARHHWKHWLAILAHGPCSGEIIRGDQDRGYAVARARRPVGLFILVTCRQRLNPELASREPPGKIAQQKECLGQHMVVRYRLPLWER